MAWTDYSNTTSDLWDANVGQVYTSNVNADANAFIEGGVYLGTTSIALPNDLTSFTPVPGFDDGYMPSGVPSPIANNIDQGGGGGSVRPSSGFLYPRGDS